MRLIVLSLPSVEARTRVTRLANGLGVPHLELGTLLRAAMAARTPLGLLAQAMVNAGDLVPDDIVLGILEERLGQPDAQAGFLLDNYPRDLAQARALDALLTRLHQPVDAAVQLEDDDGSLRERLAGAGDDVTRARLDALRARHALVAEHYRTQGKLTALAQLSAGG
jgi:adenylate kinase